MTPFLKQDSDCSIYARLLLNRLNMKEIPINPQVVAERMGIPISGREAEDRFQGCLLNIDEKMVIVLNNSIKNEARKNFTLAHEIGHAEIPHHKNKEYRCLKNEIGFAFVERQCEKEANEFAAELLMPSSFVSEQVVNKPIGLDVIKFIAE